MGVDVVAAVDSESGRFGALVENALKAIMQTALNQGVTDAVNGMPGIAQAVADRLGPTTVNSTLVTLLGSDTTSRAAMDSRYRAPLARQVYDVADFGAKGDGSTDDTAAVQAAINAALAASDTADYLTPKMNANAPVLWFPKGAFLCGQLSVPGSLRMRGVGGYAYAQSILVQKDAGQGAILQLGADTDGQSQASVIEDLGFRSASATSDGNAAQIRFDAGIGSNSVYIRRCWFFTPERYAIACAQGDDIKIVDCTFDVSPFHAIRVGSSASGCSNMQILGNTFYDIALRAIDLVNVNGCVIANNKFYKGGQTQPSVAIETVDIVSIKGISVTGNHFASIKRPLHIMTGCRTLAITGNDIVGTFDSALVVDGSSILQGLVMTGNAIACDGAMDGGSAFRCQTAAMQGCVISQNSVIAQSATARVFNAPSQSTSNNYFRNNPNINFTAYDNFASGTSNG